MSDEVKRMCKWDHKRLKKRLDEFSEAVAAPRYVCAKCIRIAHNKKKLCDPIALDPQAKK